MCISHRQTFQAAVSNVSDNVAPQHTRLQTGLQTLLWDLAEGGGAWEALLEARGGQQHQLSWLLCAKLLCASHSPQGNFTPLSCSQGSTSRAGAEGRTLEDRHPWPSTFLPALETKYRLLFTLSDDSIHNKPNIDAVEPSTCSCCRHILTVHFF